MSDATNTTAKNTILTRTINAPRQLVYDAWLKPEHLIHWHNASEGWTTPYAEVDAKVGGKIKIGFRSPDGVNDFDFEATITELREPEYIAYVIADGRPVSITLIEEGGKTNLTLDLTLETTHSEELQRHGWGEMLSNLDRYLAAK